MKFKPGDVVEFVGYKLRKQSKIKGPQRNRPPSNDLRLNNTLGIIVSCHEPSELFRGTRDILSRETSIGYVWDSYQDGIEYLVYEDELKEFVRTLDSWNK